MSISETHARLKARIWQELAQANLDLGSIPKESVEKLVDVATQAALLEMDAQLEPSSPKSTTPQAAKEDDNPEKVLWTGRPFLSISRRYIVTNERIRIIEGILGKAREDIELVRIQDIDQTQTFSERLFKLGDITIRSHNRSQPIIKLENVRDPERVHEILRRAVIDAREKFRLSYREEM